MLDKKTSGLALELELRFSLAFSGATSIAFA
jgi:hypothetical protein